METFPNSLTHFASGACDGELRMWDLSTRKCTWRVPAHEGFVRGIASDQTGDYLYSCGNDKTIKLWKVNQNEADDSDDDDDSDDEENEPENNHYRRGLRMGKDSSLVKPYHTFKGNQSFTGISHHRKKELFATASYQVDLWDGQRSEPIHSFTWGAESVYSVKFNPVETHVLASTASDRNIVLYDIRTKSPLKKLIMHNSTNCISWNPMEAYHFTTANEDHNLYTFDMRRLDHALTVHKDHVSAVMAVAYSPTGQEFITGSYDRTVRLFDTTAGHSKQVYHAKRMQRVFSVAFSGDAKYVLSGSDDTNIRLWKAHASERIAPLSARAKTVDNYRKKLKDRYQWAPEVRRIARHQHLPRAVLKAKKLKHTIHKAAQTKEDHRRKHSKPGKVPYNKEKSARIVRQYE